MIKLEMLLGVVVFVMWLFSLIEAISTPSDRVRNLPKIVWVLLILFFPFVGSIAWLVAGRPDGIGSRRSPHERAQPSYPEYDRPGRAAAVDPEKDEAFLRQVRERAEAQRKAYEAQQKRDRESDES